MGTPLGLLQRHRHLPFVLAAAVAMVPVLTAGCSTQGSAEQQTVDSPVLVEVHQMFLTVQNRAGLPLVDVKVRVVPFIRTEFSRSISRLENGEKRDIMMNELTSLDGTPFNPRMIKAKTVRVTGTDVVGKHYEIEMPW